MDEIIGRNRMLHSLHQITSWRNEKATAMFLSCLDQVGPRPMCPELAFLLASLVLPVGHLVSDLDLACIQNTFVVSLLLA